MLSFSNSPHSFIPSSSCPFISIVLRRFIIPPPNLTGANQLAYDPLTD
nr:MAG TPA: hypothetical protein [Caudoviricetes sp.]